MSSPRPAMPSRGIAFVSGYLPWDTVGSEEKRARWLLLAALLLAFVLLVVLQSITLPPVDRAQAEKMPERLAKLVMEKKKEPPPPPPKEEVVKEEEKPKEEKPKEEKPVEEKVQKAREKASKALAEAKEELAAMQDLAAAFDFGADQPLSKAGAASPSEGALSRDLITSRTGKGSGGVNIGTASSGGGGAGVAGGGKLGGAQVAKVDSNITEGGIGATRKSASGKLERTEEEIRRVMDRNNGALQAIYQRALRSNPTLKGAIVLRLVIAPDGSVTSADLVSSELGDAETEKKLLTRIKAINFGAIEGVAVWDDKYTLNFFPS